MFKRHAPLKEAREARRQQEEEDARRQNLRLQQKRSSEDSVITADDLQQQERLNISPSVGEARITGVARRHTPELQKKIVNNDRDDDEDRRVTVTKCASLAISDEHSHFASMLNKRMEKYDPTAESSAPPSARFGPNSSSQAMSGIAASSGANLLTYDSRPIKDRGYLEAVRNDLKVLGPGGSDKAGPSVFQRAGGTTAGPQAAMAPPRPNPSSFLRPTAQASAPSYDQALPEPPPKTTHIHRRQPGREGIGSSQNTPLGSVRSSPRGSLTTAVGAAILKEHSKESSCLQALAAIDTSQQRR